MTNTILLTGIPRSGTTLVCSLLNQLPNTLALVEPMNIGALAEKQTAGARRQFIDAFDQGVRDSVLVHGEVEALAMGGDGTNTFVSESLTEKRQTLISGVEKIALAKKFDPQFTLIIKHPNAFSALLSELCESWACYAIVRNPLAVVASWHSLDHPLSRGRAPMAEAFDSELTAKLDAEQTDLDRQLVLINWYFARYRSCLPADHIISYEKIVATGGQALSSLAPTAQQLDQRLSSRNTNRVYNKDFMRNAAEKMQQWQARNCAWSHYYDQASIATLAAGMIGDE